MGYRSAVKAIVYGDKETLRGYMAIEKLRDKNVFQEFEGRLELKYMVDEYAVLDLTLDDVKWYEGYDDVAAWERFMRDCVDHGLNYEFVRLGEELNDIETEQNGENLAYCLYPETTIVCDMVGSIETITL